MAINISVPESEANIELKPKITVIGIGGAGGNAVNNMIEKELSGIEFVAANTDSQALKQSKAGSVLQLGATVTEGLGAGSKPDIGRLAAEESLGSIMSELDNSHMVFLAAGMGGGTGTGAAPVIAKAARERGILTVAVVTKPFQFEGSHRMCLAEEGIKELEQYVDTLIIIPNQNLFRIATEKTTFSDAFGMADEVLYSGIRGITDLMVMPGLINLDFADIRTVMAEMGKAMMGTGEASGERRALDAAEAAIANPLLDDISMFGAKGVLINITGGPDITLFEVDEAANHIRSQVDDNAYIIIGSAFDKDLEGVMRVSVVATGIQTEVKQVQKPNILTVGEISNEPTMVADKDSGIKHDQTNNLELSYYEGQGNKKEFLEDRDADISEEDETEGYDVNLEKGNENNLSMDGNMLKGSSASGENEAEFGQPNDQIDSFDHEKKNGDLDSNHGLTLQETDDKEASPPIAMPRVDSNDAFIPKESEETSGELAIDGKTDPFKLAELSNGSKVDSEEDKLAGATSSLFELVTRGGRSAINSISQGVKEVGGDERLEESHIEPGTDLKVETGGNDKMAHEENKEITQPHFGEIKEGKDSQNVDEGDDLLDIPAFLRRQAN